jgi:putative transposase
MKPVAETLGISRSHLSASARSEPRERGGYLRDGDEPLLARIRAIVQERPSYGYRRVAARLNRDADQIVNHKRVYRLMKRAKLLLPKYGVQPARLHDGKIITLASDLRWCSDGFEIRCWNGERVHVAFALDCCDREVIASERRTRPTPSSGSATTARRTRPMRPAALVRSPGSSSARRRRTHPNPTAWPKVS